MFIITDLTDIFSNRVGDWLRCNNKTYHRINAEEPIKHIHLEIRNDSCTFSLLRQCDIVELLLTNTLTWHRRGFLSFSLPINPTDLNKEVYLYLQEESKTLSDGILMILKEMNLLIGNHIFEKGNKLYNLYLASICGIKIPNTFVTNTKERLKRIYLDYPELIVKPLSDSFFIKVKDHNLIGFVTDFDEAFLDLLPESFFPCCFQEKIDRDFEIRTFVFCGKIHSMATFMDSDGANITDLKEIEGKRKRCVPFTLPNVIKDNIFKMLKKLELDSASFDFIVDKNGDIFFLELNQFGLLNEMSYYCNYNIEEFVAKTLIENGKQIEKVQLPITNSFMEFKRTEQRKSYK